MSILVPDQAVRWADEVSPALDRNKQGEREYMRTARNIIALLLMLLPLHACQDSGITTKDEGPGGQELVLRNQVSLPLPDGYERMLIDEYSTIVTAQDYSVVYRWIDKSEIEFIGSDKPPYQFFKSAFTNPEGEEEDRFLEGLRGEVQGTKTSGDLEFYYFDIGVGRQMYILSDSLSFVVEVTFKGQNSEYMDKVIANSKRQ